MLRSLVLLTPIAAPPQATLKSIELALNPMAAAIESRLRHFEAQFTGP